MFDNFDFTNFWKDSAYALKEYVSESPSDELIASVEQELGYKLPASYIWLMKQHNGGLSILVSLRINLPVGQMTMQLLQEFLVSGERNPTLCVESWEANL